MMPTINPVFDEEGLEVVEGMLSKSVFTHKTRCQDYEKPFLMLSPLNGLHWESAFRIF